MNKKTNPYNNKSNLRSSYFDTSTANIEDGAPELSEEE